MLLDDIYANIPESYTQADRDLIEKAYYFAEMKVRSGLPENRISRTAWLSP